MGAMAVVKSVLEAAGLEDEGDRPDHRLSVRFNTCLGACAQAPVMSFDHHLAGRVSPAAAARRVSELLRQNPVSNDPVANHEPAGSGAEVHAG